jgi:hypothetical protein
MQKGKGNRFEIILKLLSFSYILLSGKQDIDILKRCRRVEYSLENIGISRVGQN